MPIKIIKVDLMTNDDIEKVNETEAKLKAEGYDVDINISHIEGRFGYAILKWKGGTGLPNSMKG